MNSEPPKQEEPPTEVTPRPSALTVAPEAAAPKMPPIPMGTGTATPISVPSGTLYILMKDYTIGLVSANSEKMLYVLVLPTSISVGDNYRNQFASTVAGASVPYVVVPTVSGPIPDPPCNFPDEASESSFNNIFLSDELNRTAPLDAVQIWSDFVFYDAASGGNEMGRVQCNRKLQWGDQMPLLLGS